MKCSFKSKGCKSKVCKSKDGKSKDGDSLGKPKDGSVGVCTLEISKTMKRVAAFLICACLGGTGRAGVLNTAMLQSSETRIVVEAGPEAPRLLELSLRGGERWQGESAEPPIDHVEMGEERRPLRWKAGKPPP